MSVTKTGAIVLSTLGTGGTVVTGIKIREKAIGDNYTPEVQNIYKYQKQYGNCIFGLVENLDKKTGGYPYEAMLNKDLTTQPIDKQKDTRSKLQKLVEDLKITPSDMQFECGKKKGQIVPIGGNNSARKWEYKKDFDTTTLIKAGNKLEVQIKQS